MSKQVRNIIIACVCLVVLIVAAIFLPKLMKKTGGTSSSAVSSTPSVTVYDAKPADVQSMAVKNEKGQYTLNRKGTNEWTVVEALAAPINTSMPVTVIETVAPVKAMKKVEDKTDNLAKYGLDKPSYTVTVKYTNGNVTLNFGKESPDKLATYFQVSGSDAIYLCDNSSTSYYTEDYRQFIDKTLYSVDSQKMGETVLLQLGGNKRDYPVEIKKNPAANNSSSGTGEYIATHIMTKPIEYGVNPDKFSDYLTNIASLPASAIITSDVSAASLKKYGLDNPTYTVLFNVESKNYSLKFGNEQSDGSYPLMYNDNKVIYSIASTSMTYIKKGFKDLASRQLLMPNIVTVKTVTFTGAINQKFDLEVVSEDEKSSVKNNGKILNLSNFKSFYQVLIGMQLEDLGNKPNGVQPSLTVRYDYKDSKKASDVIEFVPITAQKYAAVLNGVGKFYVLSTSMDKLINDCSKLLAGQTVNP